MKMDEKKGRVIGRRGGMMEYMRVKGERRDEGTE